MSIQNVINISVSQAGSGASAFNTSNTACFTAEVPGEDFGDLGYKIYLSPTDVATDFGSASKTYKASLEVFSQAPNILAAGGYFVVILLGTEVQRITPSGVAVSGDYVLNYGAEATTAIGWDADASEIQDTLRVLPGLELVEVTGDLGDAHFDVSFKGVYGAIALLTVTADTLATVVPAAVTLTVTHQTVGETLGPAITRTVDLVQYAAIGITEILGETDLLAAAAVVQPLWKVALFVGNDVADIATTTGKLFKVKAQGYTKSRCLFYDESDDDQAAMDFMWGYIGRGFSTNFSGNNTTSTMHMKDLTGVSADPNITQTLLNLAKAAGADCFVSIQGLAQPKVFCSGENKFFDQVYNLMWFITGLQIAGTNALATTSTKLPQTDEGIEILVNAYGTVCEQGVTNRYIAPGAWNLPDFFGNQLDFLRNIRQLGYYIYVPPVAQQSATDRNLRKAPLIQIAIKEAGAVHSSDVLVNVNA